MGRQVLKLTSTLGHLGCRYNTATSAGEAAKAKCNERRTAGRTMQGHICNVRHQASRQRGGELWIHLQRWVPMGGVGDTQPPMIPCKAECRRTPLWLGHVPLCEAEAWGSEASSR